MELPKSSRNLGAKQSRSAAFDVQRSMFNVRRDLRLALYRPETMAYDAARL